MTAAVTSAAAELCDEHVECEIIREVALGARVEPRQVRPIRTMPYFCNTSA
jgi:hypothetical protein